MFMEVFMNDLAKQTAVTNGETVEDIPVFVPKKQSRFKKILKRIIGIVILLAVISLIAFGVYKVFAPKKVETATATVTRGPITSQVNGSGSITPAKTQDVVGLAKGEVKEVFVKTGDIVTKGMSLFAVNDEELQKQLAAAEEDVQSAQKSIDKNLKKIDGLSVKAPIKGKVLEIKVKVGDQISESTPIGTIADDSKMRLTLYFSTAYIDQIKVGQKAEVSIPQSMAKVPGTVEKVEKINRITPEGTVLFEVQIVMNNPGALAKDMNATAFVNTAKGQAAPAESGVLDYYQQEVIFPEAAGTITSLDMKNYYTYEKGATLLTLENTEYQEQLDTLNDTLATKKEAADNIRKELKNYYPVAEIDGTVLSVNIAPGDTLDGSSTVVVSIADVSKMRVDAQIDELDVGKLTVGMPATINVDSEKGSTSYMGTLTSIAMQGKSENGYSYFPAVIEFEGSADLRSGMWVSYTLTSSTKDNVLLLPFDAVKYTDAGTVVLVKDTGTKPANYVDLPNVTLPEGFIPVSVQVGSGDGTNLEIVSGVEEGTEVALGELKDNGMDGPGGRGGKVVMVG